MRALLAAAALSLLAPSRGTEIRGMKHPALSPDGKRVAFSWRGDLWVCPAAGGEAERLTDHPADEQKPAWSPDGARLAYSTDAAGNRDLRVLDLASRKNRTLTVHSSDDDAPAWSPDGRWIAFQSNRDSNLDLALNNAVWDVWRMPAEGGTATRVTRFRGENPAWSPDGKWIAYDRYASGYSDGEHNVFLIAPDGSAPPRELAAGGEDSRRPVFRGQAVYFAHQANGILASDQRNVWRTSVNGGSLFQVTGHRGDHVTWPTTSEKADVLVYEFDFDLYSVDLRAAQARPRRLTITTSHAYDDQPVPKTHLAGFRSPAWSPDGKRIAFACRGDLWIASVEGGAATSLTGGVDEDRDPAWMPDGSGVVFVSGPSGLPGHILRVPAKGGTPEELTREEGLYSAPRVSPDGGRLLYSRAAEGETDLWVLDLWKREAKPVTAEKGVEESWGCFSPDGKTLAWIATRDGRSQVVVGGKALGASDGLKRGLCWSPDGKSLFFAARDGSGGWNGRLLPVTGGGERRMAPQAQSAGWAPDSTMLIAETDPQPGRESQVLTIFDVKSDSRLPLRIELVRPTTRSEEMLALFLQVYGSYHGAYYDPFFHGVDMPALRAKYAPHAAACRTKPELYELVNDFIRELRSSHIGLRPAPVQNSVVTGSLAADLGRDAEGALVVISVERDGPAARAGIVPGDRIAGDLDRLLTFDAAAGLKEVELEVRDAAGTCRGVKVTGGDRNALRELKYLNRISRLRKRVDELSGGRLAYHHIRMMNQDEVNRLRKALETEFPEKAGLVLDERDGVGGMAHRPVCHLLDSTAPERLNRNPACHMRNRNGTSVPDRYAPNAKPPGKCWDKPVIMIQNEISRSDKEILPYTFRHLGIGYLVGMPTAGGVIGGSDWTMQDGSRITVSVQGWFTAEGRNMEGWGVPPDYRVPETHEDLYAGRDAQLEKAVEVLLAQMDGRLAGPRRAGDGRKPEGAPGK
jgi:Tol biopolymer transport system component/C-terminal processing protease CtpA/Prc